MKKAVSIFVCLVGIFTIFPLSIAQAGNYHIKGQNLNCYDCHTLHFSQDGTTPQVPDGARPWGEGPQDYLLKNTTSEMCLMCHDGSLDDKIPVVMYSPSRSYQSSAGYLGEEKAADNEVFGHTLNSPNPPPGCDGTWEGTLSCTSCHDPHGNQYYRNLKPKPLANSKNSPVTYFQGTSVNGNEDKAVQIAVDPADASSSPYDLTKIIYRQEGESEEGTAGLSFWCAGCHTAYNHRGLDQRAGKHPTYGITMSQAKSSISDWWTQTATGPPTSSTRPPTVTSPTNDTDRGEDRPFCGSCHKAHGSTHRYGLLWENPAASDREDGRYMRDTCQACHHIGNGRYESSPHADPNFGVYRVPEFGRGECEQCHRQHGPDSGEHNLFTRNDKSLCMTADCHGDVPAYYPLSEENLPQGAKARIEVSAGPGNEGTYLGYFEANWEVNNTAVRLSGLQYRGRWPGALAYNNELYSPHGRENAAMPNDGSCMNCHSPHGTSRFDMLQLPYEGTSGSGSEGADNYELCLSCHSEDGPNGMRPETKRIADFYNQDDLYAGHRIKSAGGFAKPGDKLACSNCHNPHGSLGNNQSGPNLHLLSDERPGWKGLDTLNDPNSSRRFCFGCHVPSNKPAGKSIVEGIVMKTIPDFAEHRDGEGSTESCHSCHGNSYAASDSENVHHPSPGSCDKCHADQGAWEVKAYSGPHRYHTDKYAIACEACHARMNRTAGKATHGNGKVPGSNCQDAEVCFHDGSDAIEWKNQTLHQKIYRYRSLYHNPYFDNSKITPGYDASTYDLPGTCTDDTVDPNRVSWTNQSAFNGHNSCSTVWCHSNANPLSVTNYPRENSYQANPSFALTWDNHDGNRCNNCHGFTDLDQPAEEFQLSSYHRKHVVVTTPNKNTTGKAKILCNKCHADTCTDNANIIREGIGYSNHVDGEKNIVFADPNGKYVVGPGDRTCSVNCHSRDGELLSVSWVKNPEPVCGTCHDVFGPGTTISRDGHSIHLISKRGPGPHSLEQCDDCHTSHDDPAHCNGVVDFKDGQLLGKTTVCDKCHSPGGDYDGVNDPEIGAKANWRLVQGRDSNLYEVDGDSLRLRQGKEKWCVGCHDKKPASSRSDGSGVSAPNVAGDETCPTLYGKGYGYFVTGHGLAKGRSYPGSEEEGAGASCTYCHDAGLGHIDHTHRTYSAVEDNYRTGYRLKSFGLERPMDIPRTAATGPNNDPQRYWEDFDLCFQCHNKSALLGSDPLQTNFYNNSFVSGSSGKSINLHTYHLSGRGGGGNSPDWTSSWNSTGDSAMSCPACHNVHGSPTPRMMRHGELISTPGSKDKVPGLNFHYKPNPPPGTILADSSGGEIFSQFSQGKCTVSQNKICETCHPAFVKYYRTPYINPDNINPQILSVVACNSPTGGKGIDDGDQLIITFTTATNGPDVISPSKPEDANSIIKIYGDIDLTQKKAWSTPANIEWSSAGGHPNDTLRIILEKAGTDIAVGDYLKVPAGNLNGIVGDVVRPIDASRKITGTFDCAIVRVCAENQSLSQDPGIQEGDGVTIYFSGPIDVSGNGTHLTAANIDKALKLNNGHTWGPIKDEDIRWNVPACDTLTIIFPSELPSNMIAIGDRIILEEDIICDRSGYPLRGSAILEGSFDSYPLLSPLDVYSYNIAGPPWGNTLKSIDTDLNTLWFLGPAAEGKIGYDLAAMYRVSRVWIHSGDSGGKASVKVWITGSPGYDENSPTIASWEIPVTPGWHDSPQVDVIGRYLRIEAKKIGNGPLGELFQEVAFQGTTVLPYINPRILRVEAINNDTKVGTGVNDGDRVIITFNVSTNGPDVIGGTDDVASILGVYGDIDHKAETQKSWGTLDSIAWSDEGGQANDTLRITLKEEGATIAAGDHIEVSSLKLKGRVEGLELAIISSQVISGTFDCSLIRAVAGNQSKSLDAGIQEGDQVIISFAGQTGGNGITQETINTALPVGNGHSWGQVKAIEWNAPANDTLKITFGPGNSVSAITVGDTITLGDIICDQSQHPIKGSVTLTGSFNPPVVTWRTPETIHSFSPTGGGNANAGKTIDNNTNTSWGVLGGTARITYDLETQHQVSHIQLFSGDSRGKVSVKAWVSDEPVYDPNIPTAGPFEISGASGWIPSPYQFYAKGRYLTLEVKKLSPGPLGSFIAEVQYQDGEVHLPDITPRISDVEARNTISGGAGIDDGDHVVITFNVPTNGPEVIGGPDDVASILSVYGDIDHKAETQKSWGTPGSIAWSNEGGQANDTLRIILKKDGGTTIAPGDHIEVSSLKLKARVEEFELPIISSQVVSGTFDCSLLRAIAGNQSQDPNPGIQAGDQVVISFAGQTGSNAITEITINDALRLSNDHSWGQVNATWNDPNTLTITFEGGTGTSITVGDQISLGNVICDQSQHQHPIKGSVTLIGSFDPPVATWRTPEAIHSFSPTGGGNANAGKTTDNDTNTSWSVSGGTAQITFDLEPKYQTQYQVSRIQVFSGDSRVKASVKVWVTASPVYDQDAPTYGPYEISQASWWDESLEFTAIGRYLTLEIKKLTPGPLGNFIGEIQFFGMAPPASP